MVTLSAETAEKITTPSGTDRANRIRLTLYEWIHEEPRALTKGSIIKFWKKHLPELTHPLTPRIILGVLQEGIEKGFYELKLHKRGEPLFIETRSDFTEEVNN